jgi:hypothetical protein
MYQGSCFVMFAKNMLWVQAFIWSGGINGSIIITPESLTIKRWFPFRKAVILKKSDVTGQKIQFRKGPLSYIQFLHKDKKAPSVVVAGYFDDTKDVSAMTALRLCGYPELK